jgi:hypothetical protein
MTQSRLQIAKKDILSHFESLGKRVFSLAEIDFALSHNRHFWRLTQSTGRAKFIDFLCSSAKLREVELLFPSRKRILFVWGEASDYEIVQNLGADSYFTHFTALHLHNLTLQIPKTLYLNSEQPEKHFGERVLEQVSIDNAFRRPCRISRTVAQFGQRRICLLSGQQTGQRGVISIPDEMGNDIRVTDLERTLIDIVVRPVYSGGVHAVLEAYRQAAGGLKVNRLAAMLSSLRYLYPYHQAIGFYLDKSGGYSETQISLLERFDMKYDFYLEHQIKQRQYSERWRIYYPKGL